MSRAKSTERRWLRPESALGAGLVVKAGALVLALAWALWLGLVPEPNVVAGPAVALAQEGLPEKPAEAAPAEPAPGTEPAASEPAAPPQFDPRLIQLIEQKRADLAVREAALAKEREQIEKLKADAMARIDELKKVQAALEELIKAEQNKREERIQQMVKLLANMRPDAAGAVVSKLDDQMAVEIFSRMQPRIAGKVMAALDPGRAARIGEVLTHQKQAREAAAIAQQAAATAQQPQARPAPAQATPAQATPAQAGEQTLGAGAPPRPAPAAAANPTAAAIAQEAALEAARQLGRQAAQGAGAAAPAATQPAGKR